MSQIVWMSKETEQSEPRDTEPLDNPDWEEVEEVVVSVRVNGKEILD